MNRHIVLAWTDGVFSDLMDPFLVARRFLPDDIQFRRKPMESGAFFRVLALPICTEYWTTCRFSELLRESFATASSRPQAPKDTDVDHRRTTEYLLKIHTCKMSSKSTFVECAVKWKPKRKGFSTIYRTRLVVLCNYQVSQ